MEAQREDRLHFSHRNLVHRFGVQDHELTPQKR